MDRQNLSAADADELLATEPGVEVACNSGFFKISRDSLCHYYDADGDWREFHIRSLVDTFPDERFRECSPGINELSKTRRTMDYNNLSAEEADELIKREPGTVVQDKRFSLCYRLANGKVNYGYGQDWLDTHWESLQQRHPHIRYRVISRPNPQPEKLTGAQALERGARTCEPFTWGSEFVWFRVSDRGLQRSRSNGEAWADMGNKLQLILEQTHCRMVARSEWFDAVKEEPVEPVLGAKFVAMIRDRYPDHEAAGQRIEFYRELMIDCVIPLVRSEIAKAKEVK